MEYPHLFFGGTMGAIKFYIYLYAYKNATYPGPLRTHPRPTAKDPKDPEKSAAPRLPLPTPLMAATASAKRAEPPAVVVKPQKEDLERLAKMMTF